MAMTGAGNPDIEAICANARLARIKAAIRMLRARIPAEQARQTHPFGTWVAGTARVVVITRLVCGAARRAGSIHASSAAALLRGRACGARFPASGAIPLEAVAGAAFGRVAARAPITRAHRADVIHALRIATGVLEVAWVADLPTGNAGAVEAIGRAALEEVIACHSVTAANHTRAVHAAA